MCINIVHVSLPECYLLSFSFSFYLFIYFIFLFYFFLLKVLLLCFTLCTISYASMAVFGYLMFGSNVQSQITLNLPTEKLSSRVAICTTLVNPIAKYALMVTPVVNAIKSWFPYQYNKVQQKDVWPLNQYLPCNQHCYCSVGCSYFCDSHVIGWSISECHSFDYTAMLMLLEDFGYL